MKKSYLFLLFIALPCALFAKQNLTVLGGASLTNISQKTPALNPAFSIKYGITKGKTTFGIRVDAYDISSKETLTITNLKNEQVSTKTTRATFMKPAIMPDVYLETHVPFSKSNLIFGVDMGAALAFNGNAIPQTLNYAYGFIVGAHVGYSYSISKNFRLVSEIGPRYIGFLNIDSYNTFALPLSIGVSFTF